MYRGYTVTSPQRFDELEPGTQVTLFLRHGSQLIRTYRVTVYSIQPIAHTLKKNFHAQARIIDFGRVVDQTIDPVSLVMQPDHEGRAWCQKGVPADIVPQHS